MGKLLKPEHIENLRDTARFERRSRGDVSLALAIETLLDWYEAQAVEPAPMVHKGETNYLGHVDARSQPRYQTVSFTGTVCSYEDWPAHGTAQITIAAKTSEAKGVHVHFVGDEVSIVMVGKHLIQGAL